MRRDCIGAPRAAVYPAPAAAEGVSLWWCRAAPARWHRLPRADGRAAARSSGDSLSSKHSCTRLSLRKAARCSWRGRTGSPAG